MKNGQSHTPRLGVLDRRRVALGLAASPFALIASRGWADQFDVATPPVFAEIAPARLKPAALAASPFPLRQVRLLDSPWLEAQRWNIGYMKRLEVDRLLHTFRINAGLTSSATPLGGWEAPDCELRGHFVGHYLSGAAIAFASTGDEEMRRRGDALVDGLAQCQATRDDGYLSAFPVSFFDRLAAGKQVWAPFYTLHKIMAGLLDMYDHAGNDQALTVLTGMAGWVDQWTAARDEPAMQQVLETEFGGMNDVLYRLAAATGDARWIATGDRFTKKRVFEPLAGRKDRLRGLHMNTHVPQVIGAAIRFETTQDPRFRDVADFFWETVTEARTYATGGSSNKEHWLTEPNHLGFEWEQGHNHQECCCSYNMMKLGAHLFAWAPNAAIMDYYERNLLNHRLGMIQPDTGLTGYFLSMSPGAWKTHGTEETTFWCCNGTALEDFSRLASMVYAHDEAGAYVNLFIPSTLDWHERGVRLRQETNFPTKTTTRLTIEASDDRPWTLRLRVPGWTSDRATLKINGAPVSAMAAPGSYLTVTRTWRAGDRIEFDMPMALRLEAFSDRPQTAALLYGPVVLAQQLPMGTIPAALMIDHGPDLAKAPPPVAPAPLPADIAKRLTPVAGSPLHFEAILGERRVSFKPINQSWERYAAYSTII
jgi:DUF1680 family protein